MNNFEYGVFYSAALIVNLHGDTVIACDLLKEANLFGADVSELDNYEMEALVKILENENRAYFTNVRYGENDAN